MPRRLVVTTGNFAPYEKVHHGGKHFRFLYRPTPPFLDNHWPSGPPRRFACYYVPRHARRLARSETGEVGRQKAVLGYVAQGRAHAALSRECASCQPKIGAVLGRPTAPQPWGPHEFVNMPGQAKSVRFFSW